MAPSSRVRSTSRGKKHPSVTDVQPLDGSEPQHAASTDGGSGGDGASESLPDVTLQGEPVPVISRAAQIEQAAYRRAEGRGFEPGYDLDDWLTAEREFDAAGFGENVSRS